MPAGNREPLAQRVADLDPTVRALLDLTLRRGFSDPEVGQLLQIPPEQVAALRKQTLGWLTSQGDTHDSRDPNSDIEAQLRGLDNEVWLGVEKPAVAEPEPGLSGPPSEPGLSGPPKSPLTNRWSEDDGFRARRERRWRIQLGAAVLVGLIAVIVAVWALATRGDSSPTGPVAPSEGSASGAGHTDPSQVAPTSGNTTAPPARPPGRRPTVPFISLPGAHEPGRVTIERAGRDVIIRLQRVAPPGPDVYTLWLYNTRSQSRRLASVASVASGTAQLRIRLPNITVNYGSIDLSLENSPQDRRHAAESLFRVGMPQVLWLPWTRSSRARSRKAASRG